VAFGRCDLVVSGEDVVVSHLNELCLGGLTRVGECASSGRFPDPPVELEGLDADALGRLGGQLDDILVVKGSSDGRLCEAPDMNVRLHVQVDRNAEAPTCRDFAEPSDGLEPSTPSLPWKSRSVTRVHARSLATQSVLQIGMLQAVQMRRETSFVSFLMCPFCVRVPSSDLTTLWTTPDPDLQA
jgi:hypothetical protein